jgi:hypothetical protein
MIHRKKERRGGKSRVPAAHMETSSKPVPGGGLGETWGGSRTSHCESETINNDGVHKLLPSIGEPLHWASSCSNNRCCPSFRHPPRGNDNPDSWSMGRICSADLHCRYSQDIFRVSSKGVLKANADRRRLTLLLPSHLVQNRNVDRSRSESLFMSRPAKCLWEANVNTHMLQICQQFGGHPGLTTCLCRHTLESAWALCRERERERERGVGGREERGGEPSVPLTFS